MNAFNKIPLCCILSYLNNPKKEPNTIPHSSSFCQINPNIVLMAVKRVKENQKTPGVKLLTYDYSNKVHIVKSIAYNHTHIGVQNFN